MGYSLKSSNTKKSKTGLPSLQEKLSALPRSPGVYLFKNKSGRVIYVGKAQVLRNRVRQYFQSGHDGRYQYDLLVSSIADLEVITTDTELEALILENNLVRLHKPRYNVALRDDKSLPYLRITAEEFPRIFLTRRPVQDGSRYSGPYANLWHLKGLLRLLRGMLKIRTCNLPLTEESIAERKFKSCLEYDIGRCNAPCIGTESQETYGARVRDFIDVVHGRGSRVLNTLRLDIERLADELKFEEAARLRDWLSALENLTQRQKVISAVPIDRDIFALAVEDTLGCVVVMQVRSGRMIGRLHFRVKIIEGRELSEILEEAVQRYYSSPVMLPSEILLPIPTTNLMVLSEWLKDKAGHKVSIMIPERGDKVRMIEMARRNAELMLGEYQLASKTRQRIPAALTELQKRIDLPRFPETIAAFDISNLMGTQKVASMVVFKNGKAARSQYRHYKIKSVEGADDYASMKEVIGRRFARLLQEDLPFPDLVLIDGGKGQLSAACEALNRLDLTDQPIVGLAKRLEELFLPDDPVAYNLPKTSSALKLLQQVRDEAHRFAIQYHRRLRKKAALTSQLDEIEGVGPSRRRILLRHFGSVKRIQEASRTDLTAVKGLPERIADEVYKHFHS